MSIPVLGPIITAVGSVLGAGVKGFFGAKEKKAEVITTGITTAMSAFESHNMSEKERMVAISSVIASAHQAGGIARIWRPLSMLIFVGLIVAFWFGFAPPNIEQDLPPALREIFELVKIGLMGYLPLRTIDKAVESYNGRKILERITEKVLDSL